MPNLNPDALAAHVRDPLASVYVLHGNEPLFLMEAGDQIRQAARRQGYTDREVVDIDGADNRARLEAAALGVSLFASQKLIDVRVTTGKPGAEGGSALQAHVKNNYAGVVTLITITADWSTRKTAWFKVLQEHSVHIKLDTPPPTALPQWLGKRLQAQGQYAPDDALLLIKEQVEGNLLGAHGEIIKLGLLYPRGALTLKQVHEALSPIARFEENQLKECLLEGNFPRAVQVLNGLQNHGAPKAEIFLLWLVTQIIRVLAQLRWAMDHHQPLPLQKLVPFRPHWPLYEKNARLSTLSFLHQCLHHAAYIDQVNKGVEKGEAWGELLRLCQRLCHA